MKLVSGLKLLEQCEGEGRPAGAGDRVVYNMRLFLNKGEEVPLNAVQAETVPKDRLRADGGVTFLDHTIRLGQREAIAGVELTLMGMKVGGYRNVRISPHLAYRDKGVPDLIPPHAVLRCELWLREILEKS